MLSAGNDSASGWLIVIGAGLLGCFLSALAEVLIARLIPRLGGLPTLPARVTTATLTGTVCTLLILRFGPVSVMPAFLLFAVLGAQLARIDFVQHLLPNPLVLTLLAGGFLSLTAAALYNKQADDLLRAVAGAVILFLGYLILALISPGALGMGDVKLAAPVGLYLGYLGWSQLLYGGLFGFILNGAVSVAIVLVKRRNLASEVAHGPAMLAATVAAAVLFH